MSLLTSAQHRAPLLSFSQHVDRQCITFGRVRWGYGAGPEGWAFYDAAYCIDAPQFMPAGAMRATVVGPDRVDTLRDFNE